MLTLFISRAIAATSSPSAASGTSSGDSNTVWAIAAVVVSILTLIGVGWQIRLARRTVDLTRDELKLTNAALDLTSQELELAKASLNLTTKELDLTNETLLATQESSRLVQESLTYAREQSERLQRSSDLHFYADLVVEGAPTPAVARTNPSLTLKTYLANYGSKSADGAVVQLLFPPGLSLYLTHQTVSDWGDLGFWWDGMIRRKHWERRLTQKFYPGTLQYAFDVPIWHSERPADGILWRVLYDDGVTPPGGVFTRLTTLTALDRTKLIASVPPPAD
jgi:hypothetical protein